MPDDTLYHGTFYLTDTSTGEEVNVAMQLAISDDQAVYTLRGLACDTAPVTVATTDRDRVQWLRDLLAVMLLASVPAEPQR